MKHYLTAVLMLSLATVHSIHVWGAESAVGQCANAIPLSADASFLKTAFNDAKGKVRLLFVVDPICPACLRGAADMSRQVLDRHRGDSNLETLVVHLPVIGGKESDTRRTCKALSGPAITHYWDSSGDFGRVLSKGIGLKSKSGKEVYAWDVWLLYGREAEWIGASPPRPAKLMHQLMALSDGSDYEFFDAQAFAESVTQALGASVPNR